MHLHNGEFSRSILLIAEQMIAIRHIVENIEKN